MARLNVALKVAIIESGKKQKTIARLARIDDMTLSRYVHYRRPVQRKHAERLAAVLEKSVADLFPEFADAAVPA